MTQHTKTPWYVHKTERSYRIATTPEPDGETRYIAVILDNGEAEQEANAEFICRACNAHDALWSRLVLMLRQGGK